MERLTIRVDNGLEEIYFYNPDDPEGEYTLSDIAKNGHDDICDQIANRLAAYEDTGLTPEQIKALTADKDEQAGRIMQQEMRIEYLIEHCEELEYLLRRTLPILEFRNRLHQMKERKKGEMKNENI